MFRLLPRDATAGARGDATSEDGIDDPLIKDTDMEQVVM